MSELRGRLAELAHETVRLDTMLNELRDDDSTLLRKDVPVPDELEMPRTEQDTTSSPKYSINILPSL
eukprot:1082949-Amphidinium_carterae.1